MNLYNFIFIWLVIIKLLSNKIESTTMENYYGKEVQRWKITWAFLVMIPVFYLAVFTVARYDTVAYLINYNSYPNTFDGLKYTLENANKGKGFVAFSILEKIIFGDSELIYRFIICTIQIVPVVLIFRKYSDNYLLSIYIFLASSCHIAWLMNGLRQFIAVAIIFAATPLLLKKKYIPILCIILFASTIHTTALIMIPVIFIVQGEAWNKKTIIYIILSVIAMRIFSQNSEVLDAMLEGTEYAGAQSYAVSEWNDDGVHPLRVLVSSVPAVLSFIGRKKISEEKDQMINICVNMSIITVGINLIAMVTSGITIGRLPIYTSMYGMILLPYLIRKIFDNREAQFVNWAMIAFYAIYYTFE